MARNTIKERLEAGLTALGWRKEASTGHRTSGWTKAGDISKIFVGENGGFRAGRCKSQSHSIQYTPFYEQTLAAGDAAIAATPRAKRDSALNEFTEAT